MKVLLADEDENRARVLCERLTEAGCTVFVDLGLGTVPLTTLLLRYQPDALIVDARSPSRALIEELMLVSHEKPCPIVLCAEQAEPALARAAVKAGAQALIVGDATQLDFATVLEAACAQFEQLEHIKGELAAATRQLAERKLIERAKGILMKQRGLSEEEAYRILRSTAMERKARLVVIAEQVIAVADLMG